MAFKFRHTSFTLKVLSFTSWLGHLQSSSNLSSDVIGEIRGFGRGEPEADVAPCAATVRRAVQEVRHVNQIEEVDRTLRLFFQTKMNSCGAANVLPVENATRNSDKTRSKAVAGIYNIINKESQKNEHSRTRAL